MQAYSEEQELSFFGGVNYPPSDMDHEKVFFEFLLSQWSLCLGQESTSGPIAN